jgi:hypothetical protein
MAGVCRKAALSRQGIANQCQSPERRSATTFGVVALVATGNYVEIKHHASTSKNAGKECVAEGSAPHYL